MALAKPVFNDLSAGELSPRMAGRVDLGAFHKGAQELTNFQVRLMGGAGKRPGTKYLMSTRLDNKARLFPFTIDSTTTLVLELTAGHTRFIYNGALVVDSGSTVIDIPNSYTEAELFEVRSAQTFREMYLVHPAHAPFWIRFISGTPTAAVFEYIAADQGFAGNLLEWTAPAVTTLEPTYEVYDLWEFIAQWLVPRRDYTASGTFNGKTLTKAKRLDLSLVLTFSDLSTLTIDRASTYSYVGTISIDLRPFIGMGNYPGAVAYFGGRLWLGGSYNDPTTFWGSKPWDYKNFVLCETVEYKVEEKTESARSDHTATSTSGNATLTGLTPTVVAGSLVDKYGTGEFIPFGAKVISNTTNSVTFDMPAIGAGTRGVSFSNWKDANVPEYAEEIRNTQQIGAANAVRIILATEEDERILWICAANDIYVGTTSSEWVIPGTTNANASRAIIASRYGSANVQARHLGEAIVHVTANSRHLRQVAAGGQPGSPLTAQAEHMLRPGVIQLEFSQSPDLCLWAVLGNGELARCLVESSMGVMAWDRVRVRTGDTVESIAVCPGSTRDEVFIVVRRQIGASVKRFIEILQENEDDLVSAQWYVDAGVSKSGAAFTSVSGLGHLEGETVAYRALLAAGAAAFGTAVVAAGAVTIPSSTWAVVGLPFKARIRLHRIDYPETEGRIKGVGNVFIRFFRSCSCILRGSLDPTAPTTPITLTDTYTGPFKAPTDLPMEMDTGLIIDSDDPVPLCIQSVIPDTAIGG